MSLSFKFRLRIYVTAQVKASKMVAHKPAGENMLACHFFIDILYNLIKAWKAKLIF